jgi:hypothetical protein
VHAAAAGARRRQGRQSQGTPLRPPCACPCSCPLLLCGVCH